MKNKLLLSTALVGGLALSGIASAQTTVTGEINLSWKSIDNGNVANPNATTIGNQNDSGFGRETQLNIQNKGKLSNGVDYAAGFSLEFDGLSGKSSSGTDYAATDSRISRIANENVFVDLIFGPTTISVGSDHLNNMSFSSAPRVAQHFGTTLASAQYDPTGASQASAAGGGVAYKFYPGGATMGASNYMGIGAQHVTPYGTITGQFFPKASAQQAGNDGVARTSVKTAYEAHFRGDLGVKGLSFNAGYNMIAQNGATTTAGGADDQIGKAIGIGYNFGTFAVGVQKNYTNNGGLQSSSTLIDTDSTEIGATYALTKELTLGAQRVKTQGVYFGTASMTTDEVATAYSIGYNLGAINSSLTYAKLSDARGVAGNDSDILLVRTGIKF